MNIGVVGAGSWGTALAKLMGEKGYQVALWVRRAELMQTIRDTGQNSDYLPEAQLPGNIVPTCDLEEAVRGKELVVLAVPSHAVREAASRLRGCLEEQTIVVNTSKGLEEGSLKRPTEVITEALQSNAPRVAVLSGPNHAEEVCRCMPAATVIASNDKEAAERAQDIFMTEYFRVYTNPDVIGVELGGSLKNIIAIGAGICDGLNFGDNSKAALLTRGLVEITRLGVAMGARSNTFSGLTGVGDLFVTCTSKHSRNRYVGLMLGEGKKLDEITSKMKMVAEGIKTTSAAYRLAQLHGVEMPITAEMYNIIFRGVPPQESVKNLMRREKNEELAF